MTSRRSRAIAALKLVAASTLALALFSVAGAQQAFPSRPVNVVVPFPPGGGADALMRILQAPLSQAWGQSVVIENRPGAAGLLGADVVARAAADGHTLLMTATGGVIAKNAAQFSPVALVSAAPYVVVVNPTLPVNSVRELVAYARKNPGKVTFGSSGAGAASHLAGELFQSVAGVEMLHVPYKGTGQAVADLIGGQIDLMFAPAQAAMPNVRAGKLRAIAVTSLKRSASLPDLPTVAESGVEGYDAVGWFGAFAPAGTPPATVNRIAGDVDKALADPDIKQKIMALGTDAAGGTSEAFAAFLKADNAKWERLIKERGIVVPN
ncbi:Bug family tripartite tricarboxylate transporter substrate binding protein [Xenophilus azovorans]|uniref:Bug family tripartite tricarboxylate transporter substrate binding protein n=1 Tax=Xenophilus azovorans TaxID=151755 RepID=UPI00056EBEE1|nr:tripartite tricarboxylate transporter substrate-binding protein [Xenophilus azovorans]